MTRRSRRNWPRLLRWTTKQVREIVFTIRVRSRIVPDLIALCKSARGPRHSSVGAFVSELVEAEVASFRLKETSAGIGQPRLRGPVPGAAFSRRGLRPDVVKKIENLRHLLPTAAIARRFRISRSTALRIIRAARKREHQRQTDYPQMKGLL